MVINLNEILFFDIETVPGKKSFFDLDEEMQELWSDKCTRILKSEEPPEELYERAGIYSEFGKVVCISVGIITGSNENLSIKVKSFYGDDEFELLNEFGNYLNTCNAKKKNLKLCGHNIKEFDIPYVARRMLINGISIPGILQVQGLKPWETPFIDTLELWKFGDRKNFTSLKLLAKIFGIPSPKDDISGSDVGKVYWEEGNVERIAVYCEKDVIATIQLYLKLNGLNLIPKENIMVSTNESKSAEN